MDYAQLAAHLGPYLAAEIQKETTSIKKDVADSKADIGVLKLANVNLDARLTRLEEEKASASSAGDKASPSATGSGVGERRRSPAFWLGALLPLPPLVDCFPLPAAAIAARTGAMCSARFDSQKILCTLF